MQLACTSWRLRAYSAAPRAAAKVGYITSLILTTSGERLDIESPKVARERGCEGALRFRLLKGDA